MWPCFGPTVLTGCAVLQLEVLVRTALFKPAPALVGFLLQGAADRVDAAYQPRPMAVPRLARPAWAASSPSTKRMTRVTPCGTMNRPTFVSSFASIDELGPMLRQEAIRRGLALALQVVLRIDGAEGLARIGRLCFPTALQIVDCYHALEHVGQVLAALLGSKEHPDYPKRLGRWARRLLNDQVKSLIAQTRRECAGTARAPAVEKELGYFLNNLARMQYGTFRRQGWFIGSGVIEAG